MARTCTATARNNPLSPCPPKKAATLYAVACLSKAWAPFSATSQRSRRALRDGRGGLNDEPSQSRGAPDQIQNDSTQREMLLSVVRTRLFGQTQLVSDVEWLIKTLNRLSLYRNILIHTEAIFSPYMRQAPSASPAGARIASRQRFDIITHDKVWRDLAGDLNSLTAYGFVLSTLMQAVPSPPHSSLRKPKLLSLEQIDRIEAQISRLAQSKARSRQQSSSTATPAKRRNARA
jgi:hypothetical protein